MRRALISLAFTACLTHAYAQAIKTPTSAQATPKAAAPAVSTATESEADKAGKAELVERVFTEQSYLYSQLIEKCFTFKLSPACWAKFSDPANTSNQSGFGAMRYWCRFVTAYAKREGLGDLEALKGNSKEEEKDNRPQMDEIIKTLREKFSLTVEAPTNCTTKGYELMMGYPYEVLDRIGERSPYWSSKSGEAHFRVIASPSVKDISVRISPDGKQFTVSGPALVETVNQGSNIQNGLERANKNR
ncbi:hypothetical protein [Spirosoma pollinicola]|uniref:Uncharacterized protein n=1 Tax=Spirosoma pollinicola TaxID=2057025 RepID=A0A2K8Z879_9BACT|nr:hypothetical protein [Spirosoma pollinicola]AUD06071.1 hypothetical protein CWM47_32040 [Spirosoma pollinicola]